MLCKTAFIISGCTFTSYTKVLRYSLGIQTIYSDSFQDTIKYMHPIVEAMVDDACAKARDELKKACSWKKAVTTADGVWQTRGITQRISPLAFEALILVHSCFGSISARREGKE